MTSLTGFEQWRVVCRPSAQNAARRLVNLASPVVAFVLMSGPTLVFAQSEQLHGVLPRDAIPTIDDPSFRSAARSFAYSDDEVVIGVVGDREQRAYSTWELDTHEIVNDTFEGRPIAATW